MRTDETHKRLLDWTYGQPPSERLAAQVLAAEGYEDVDPSHPLGGRDGGRDGECKRKGGKGVWAVYFSRGQNPTLTKIKNKLKADIDEARQHKPKFLVFVTNQEVGLADRETLRALGGDVEIELLHLERVAGVLDRPHMAQVRQQFLGIPAIGVAPLDVKVSVDGCAYAFTDDGEVRDTFVAMREDRIRKRSDEGHERIRKEKEAAERERAARDAERARQARQRPWDVGLQMRGVSDMINESGLMDSLMKQFEPTIRPEDFPIGIAGIPSLKQPKPPEPLSEEEIQTKVAEYRDPLKARWPACRDYLASVGFPALRFRIANAAETFLTDVEIILTFHGARGVRFKGLQAYEWMKIQDPNWEPPSDPRFGHVAVPPFELARPKDYPIEWRHNDDGDLEVIVTLAQLRPYPEWRSDYHGDDVVLIVDPHLDSDEITVSYTVTANPYGKHLVGEPFTVPVERRSMREVMRATDAASKEAT
ncbi:MULTISPECIES: hypothetical protein [unclassified Mycobacterium]|uniref:hypothetical protein n=1 Tax=unclassified Mycobacterium TaxID=2642494 RepID=UPI0012DEEA1D|nr:MULTISPECIES: hypothetical protein [unclassified Mycobacterium]